MTQEAVFFVHQGPLPKYLFKAMESARFFNPQSPIYLLCNQLELEENPFSIRGIKLRDLDSPEHQHFRKIYRHISTNSESYERFCFSRWFYVEEAMKREGIQKGIHLDSDCLLFHSVGEILSHLGSNDLAVSYGGSPHSALLGPGLNRALKHMLHRFEDESFLQKHLEDHQQSLKGGERVCLSDMTLMEDFVTKDPQAIDYHQLSLPGVLDHNINCSDGFLCWRKRKRIFWYPKNGRLLPYFWKEGRFHRAWTIHFQGRSKKCIHRFNPLETSYTKLGLRRAIRGLAFSLNPK